ncbi:S8 family serine peptidase [Streptomyces sp. A1136]|uniref:S8 family serine peptidase n=1 Tax=Streptomyces sp. A1136 TaxID=2563102 RepID=UPI001446BD71|nr:S8 family serine peptidase [Streptomyces sp. A1136]
MIVAAWTVSAGTVIPAAADTDPQRYLTKMKAPEMWKVADGTGITVAVVDSGFREVPGVPGESVLPGVSVMSPPMEQPDKKYPAHDDLDGHGTTMTAAIVGDGTGGAPKGLAPGAKVMPVRTSLGTLQEFAAGHEGAKGIRYAADNGAKIINLSWGDDLAYEVVKSAVQYAQSKGALVFAAMGNDGDSNNNGSMLTMIPGVIGVGAVDDDGGVLALSSHGPDTDLSAPGGKVPIRCTDNKGWCVGDGGTSYASALASASAALVWSAHPNWTANQVARVLIQTAGGPRDGAKRNDYVGYGVARPRVVLLDRQGDPGAPDTDPLAPAPVKAPTPSAGQTAAAPHPAASADAESRNFPWQWPALGAVVAAGLGIGTTVLVKRRRS